MAQILPVSHWLFHLANVFLAISFVSTNILLLRIILFLASVCFCLWGAIVLSISLDTVIYNAIFAIINAVQAIVIIYNMRAIKFEPEYEALYNYFFGPNKMKLSRSDFQSLLKEAEIKVLSSGQVFAKQNSRSNCLTLLLSGTMDVSKTEFTSKITYENQDNLLTFSVNSISKYEFVDSPEYLSTKSVRGPLFEVNITCITDCKIIQWQYAKLNTLFMKNGTIENTINALLGVDIARKLFNSQTKVYQTNLAAQREADKLLEQSINRTDQNEFEHIGIPVNFDSIQLHLQHKFSPNPYSDIYSNKMNSNNNPYNCNNLAVDNMSPLKLDEEGPVQFHE